MMARVEDYARAIARAFRERFKGNIDFDDICDNTHAKTYVCALKKPTLYVLFELEEVQVLEGYRSFLSAYIISPDRMFLLKEEFWEYDPLRDEWFLAEVYPEMEIGIGWLEPDEISAALASDVDDFIRRNFEPIVPHQLLNLVKDTYKDIENVDAEVLWDKINVDKDGRLIAPAYFKLLRYRVAPFTYGAFGNTTIAILLAL